MAEVEDYYTIVRARSNKMTVFIGAWRRWPNWRTAVFTYDCASLIPLDQVDDILALTARLTELSTTDVDKVLLIVIVAVVVIGGLIGAGIWNIRRQKR